MRIAFRPMPGPNVPFPPMEAELVPSCPSGDGWQYEPKWDGFRGVLENDGGELALWSRNERPLLRYFPELRPLGDLLPPHSALDGEIVIARDGVLDFDSMQMRLHPAESRVRKLSAEIPAEFIAFDVLLWDGEPLHELPLEERRARARARGEGFRLSPCTRDPPTARGWLDTLRGGRASTASSPSGSASPYLPGLARRRHKVKQYKTADCVVVGVRWKARAERSRRCCSASTATTASSTTSARRRRREAARRDRRARAAAARGRAGAPLLGAEPLGRRASSRSRRCGRSSSPRCATTRCRATASATARGCCASATTRTRASARGARCRPARGPNEPDGRGALRVLTVPPERDAYGAMMLAALDGEVRRGGDRRARGRADQRERDRPGDVLRAVPPWPPHHRAAMRLVRGRVLDVGAGRVASRCISRSVVTRSSRSTTRPARSRSVDVAASETRACSTSRTSTSRSASSTRSCCSATTSACSAAVRRRSACCAGWVR